MLHASKGTALSVHCPTFQFFSNSMYVTCFHVFFRPREGGVGGGGSSFPQCPPPPPTMHAPRNYKILGSNPDSRHHTPPKTTHAAPGPRTSPGPCMPPPPVDEQAVCIPLECFLVTARKRSLGQGNIFRSVCQEFCPQGGVCLSACWDTHTHPLGVDTPPIADTPPPPSQHPLGADTPRSRHLPGSRHPPEQTPPRSRHPPATEHAGRYGQCTGGTHPTGMQSC